MIEAMSFLLRARIAPKSTGVFWRGPVRCRVHIWHKRLHTSREYVSNSAVVFAHSKLTAGKQHLWTLRAQLPGRLLTMQSQTNRKLSKARFDGCSCQEASTALRCGSGHWPASAM